MKTFLLKLLGVFLPILKPFAAILLQGAGQILVNVALTAVKWVNDNKHDLDNDEKRKEALRIIRNDLKNQGIDVATSAVNAAIETAVVKLKSGEK